MDLEDGVLLGLFDLVQVLPQQVLVEGAVLDAHLHLLVLLGEGGEQLPLAGGHVLLLLPPLLDLGHASDDLLLLGEHLVHLLIQLHTPGVPFVQVLHLVLETH